MSIKNWLDFGGDPAHIALELGLGLAPLYPRTPWRYRSRFYY